MRIRVAYETVYTYETPVRSAIQLLRLTPRAHAHQRVGRWRVQVDAPGRLRAGEDAFGNVVHAFYLGAPVERLAVRVEGEAEVTDAAGVVAGGVERFPPTVFLRSTPLTEPDAALDELAGAARGAADDTLGRLHALSAEVGARLRFDPGWTGSATGAAEALRMGYGVCQDMAHVFLAAARRMDVPARYVSGQLRRGDGDRQEAGHAWAEAWVEGLGWVGFDPANGVSPTEAYLRVAIGPDYLAAAPVRGSRTGGGAEHMNVSLSVADGPRGRRTPTSQSQSQTRV